MSTGQVSGRLSEALADRYRIERELGAGGMATVYLAYDLRHDRHVAIKVLHEDLGATLGPERFLTEIKTTAKLQHPHILPLLDSGAVGGLLYYVMPFVDGESLRDRLEREKQLSIDDGVRLAREVADALGYAHAHGIIHRDIKPENILLQGGHAVVADFGIALAVQSAGGARLTQTGLSLGTPQYMAPEQAMGEKVIGPAADQYAVGAVTYEMLTGEPPFTGATVQAIVSKLLSAEPEPPTRVRRTIPIHVEAAVLKSLEKLPADRFANAAEFSAALLQPGTTVTRRTMAVQRSPVRGWQWATVGLGLLSLALIGALAVNSRSSSDANRIVRVEVEAGPTVGRLATVVAGARDGSGYLYCTPEGTVRTRRWESFAATPVEGPYEGCVAASYSPDGRSVAIVGIPTGLSINSVSGDAPRRDVDIRAIGDIAVYGGGMDWADDQHIYIASRNGLLRVNPADGSSQLILKSDSNSNFISLDVLPGSEAALLVRIPIDANDVAAARVVTLDLRTQKMQTILEGVGARFVKPNHVLVVRPDGALMLVPFDPKALRSTGQAITLPDSLGIGQGITYWHGLFDVTDNGTLLYWRSPNVGLGYPALVDREGKVEEVRPKWEGTFLIPRLNNDDSRFAVESLDGIAAQTWVRELRSGGSTRMTIGGALTGRPSWSPDGAVTLISDRDGTLRLYNRRLDADSATALPAYDTRVIFATNWSRDGKWLLLRTDDQAAGKGDILAVRPGVDTKATPVLASPEVSEYSPELSPDGRWLAYVSNDGGRYEVRVTPFPTGRGQWQISSNGGSEPVWSRDGRELFYVDAAGFLTAAQIASGSEFRVLSQRRLFSTTPFVLYGIWNRNYDVTRDGRFLMIRRSDDAPRRIVAVFNWAEGINSQKE